MQTRIAPSGRMTGIAGAVVLAGAFLAACGTAPADMQMTPEVRDAGAITARQVAVTVGVAGELGWEGRPVSRQELDELMRDAAAGAPRSTPVAT